MIETIAENVLNENPIIDKSELDENESNSHSNIEIACINTVTACDLVDNRDDTLSDLDDDTEVNAMILSTHESKTKNKIFLYQNPDWEIIKAGIERRARERQKRETARNEKRKLQELYENDPLALLDKRVSKRFKSTRINAAAVAEILGEDIFPIKEDKNVNVYVCENNREYEFDPFA